MNSVWHVPSSLSPVLSGKIKNWLPKHVYIREDGFLIMQECYVIISQSVPTPRKFSKILENIHGGHQLLPDRSTKCPVAVVAGVERQFQIWSPKWVSLAKIQYKFVNISGTRLAIGMGLMIAWSMGDGAPLGEELPKKENWSRDNGSQKSHSYWKNQNKSVKIAKNQGKIMRGMYLLCRLTESQMHFQFC